MTSRGPGCSERERVANRGAVLPHHTSQCVSRVSCYSNRDEQVCLWAARPCPGRLLPLLTPCVHQTHLLWQRRPSAICHATPLHVHEHTAPVSQPWSSPPGPLRPDICLSASKLPGQTTGWSCEPRALVLSADLLTRPQEGESGRCSEDLIIRALWWSRKNRHPHSDTTVIQRSVCVASLQADAWHSSCWNAFSYSTLIFRVNCKSWSNDNFFTPNDGVCLRSFCHTGDGGLTTILCILNTDDCVVFDCAILYFKHCWYLTT